MVVAIIDPFTAVRTNMDIESILSPEHTFCNVEATSKKRAIEIAAELLSRNSGFTSDEAYRGLIAREKLGPTALGNGIALPHCRLEHCASTVCGVFRLAQPIDFEAIDDEPVSLMFVLLFPHDEEEDHLRTLAMLARRFESPDYRAHLLEASNDTELYRMALLDPGVESSRHAL